MKVLSDAVELINKLESVIKEKDKEIESLKDDLKEAEERI